MSISLADTSTTQPASTEPVSPAPAEVGSLLLWIYVGWAVLGLLVANLLGAFRRKSIVGLERMTPTDSGWDLLVMLMVGFIAGIATVEPVRRMIEHTRAQKQLVELVVNAGVDGVTFLAIILVFRFFRPDGLSQLGLNLKKIGLGLMGGAVALFILDPLVQLAGAAVEFFYAHFHLMQAKPHEVLIFLGEAHSPWVTAFAIALPVIIAPLNEELMYRGLLQTALSRLFSWMDHASVGPLTHTRAAPRWGAVVITSMIFSAQHVEPAFFAPLFVLSVGLGYAYERTSNLWVTITCHALFNAIQIVLAAAAAH